MKWALTMGGDINEAVDDGKTTSVAMSANKKMFFFFVFFFRVARW
jgi:hypothetical protein